MIYLKTIFPFVFFCCQKWFPLPAPMDSVGRGRWTIFWCSGIKLDCRWDNLGSIWKHWNCWKRTLQMRPRHWCVFVFFFLTSPEWFQYTAKFDSYSIWEGLVPGPCYKITWCSWLFVFIGWIHGCETHRHRADYTKDFLNTYWLHETLSILETPFAGETFGG